MDCNDAMIRALLLESDDCASNAFCTDFYERLKRKAFGICGAATPQEDIEDIVQDTFTAVLSSIDKFRGESELRKWVDGILRKKCLLYRKRCRYRRMSRLSEEQAANLAAKHNDGSNDTEARIALVHCYLNDVVASEATDRDKRGDFEYVLIILRTGREIPSRKQMGMERSCTEKQASRKWCRTLRTIGRVCRKMLGDMDL